MVEVVCGLQDCSRKPAVQLAVCLHACRLGCQGRCHCRHSSTTLLPFATCSCLLVRGPHGTLTSTPAACDQPTGSISWAPESLHACTGASKLLCLTGGLDGSESTDMSVLPLTIGDTQQWEVTSGPRSTSQLFLAATVCVNRTSILCFGWAHGYSSDMLGHCST